MIFRWWKERRRRKWSAKPFPEIWHDAITQNVAHLAQLTEEEYGHLQRWIQIFIAEKYWEGCAGLVVTEEMKAVIAAQAGFMARGWEDYFYEHLQSILIYPSIVWRKDTRPVGGVVSEEPTARLGEALTAGPVSLVWPHVLDGARGAGDGRNVVFHEFAHVLDWEDQFLDGTPHLENREMYARWETVLHREYQQLIQAAKNGQSSLIDPYGTTNIAEFFAVSVECFFEQAELMKHRHPEWFSLLEDFFKVPQTEASL